MSELIKQSQKRKELLKHMILQLHKGVAPGQVKTQLVRLLGDVPYSEVVEVEQQLIAEGLPQEEVLKLCDVHTEALKGHIDKTEAKPAPPGHPVHTFLQENRALEWEVASCKKLFEKIAKLDENDTESVKELLGEIRTHFNLLMDVNKHYLRKENLLFPFLEKHGVTGPPTVMWGKHDETRELLNGAFEALKESEGVTAKEAGGVVDLLLKPAVNAVEEMIYKEEQILFPMCMDTLEDSEWWEIYNQSLEIGFCLYDPRDEWQPEGIEIKEEAAGEGEDKRIQLPTGSFTVTELTAALNNIPFDMTFVDKNDTVRYFTQGRERIFARNRAILGRKVQFCHPPSSVAIVEQILNDFHSGKQDHAAFRINLGGRFIHIEYFALKDEKGEFLGTLEVTQDLTEKRKLEGDRRILMYADQEEGEKKDDD
jgi:DUF438 domain-containing protein